MTLYAPSFADGHMLNFLENHDEQRIASDFFAGNPFKAIPAMIVSACINTNPIMIYFGQEFGESGMDSEGFSGRDGRTTIFDYWSIDTIRRWNNHGRYNGHLLNPPEKKLYTFYRTLLNLCKDEPALSEGCFFDLMYVNRDGWQMNEHKQYAFLRKKDNEVLLIAVNFDGIPAHVSINIPQHAFEHLEMPQISMCEGTNLLNGEKEVFAFLPDRNAVLNIDAFNGKIIKIQLP